MKDFNRYMNEYQVKWRNEHIATTAWGTQIGKQRPWILPYQLWEQGLWPAIRANAAYSLPAYLAHNQVQKHQGVHNLKSSWVLCANLYIPFGATERGRDLLAGFLHAHVSPAIRSVEALELEYAESEESPLHPARLLGEPGGRRGAGQTSPDLAFLVNGGHGLILVENKFVEHSFYTCSGRKVKGSVARPVNPDPARCYRTQDLPQNYETLCHLVTWGRRYWEHLAPVIRPDVFSSLRCCPAARAGYQLFRQQALAEGIAASGKYDLVLSCLATDERNDTLRGCLRSTGIPDVHRWGDLFQGKANFATFSHQQWVAWVRQNDHAGDWSDWLNYVESRYGYTP